VSCDGLRSGEGGGLVGCSRLANLALTAIAELKTFLLPAREKLFSWRRDEVVSCSQSIIKRPGGIILET